MSVPTVAELIRRGERTKKACSGCGREAVFLVGADPGFHACLMCDTTAETREAAKLKAEQ